MVQDGDASLVGRCRDRRDTDAFGELVRRYRDKVFRLVVSVLGQAFAADAEDVAQEIFIRAHHSLASFRGDAAFSTWLYRIAFNHALNVKSRMRFRAPHLTDDTLASTDSGAPALDQALDANRTRAVIDACIGELPEVYQAALRLHYWTGASMAEIAELLETPENTVKSYLHRARRLLHVMLTERGIHA